LITQGSADAVAEAEDAEAEAAAVLDVLPILFPPFPTAEWTNLKRLLASAIDGQQSRMVVKQSTTRKRVVVVVKRRGQHLGDGYEE
jgi:hypothetical protein